jgi:uncharacterized protein YndB with AHSA1/START domain
MERATKNSKLIKASPQEIYKALTTPEALEVWQVPGDMTGKVHSYDLRVGGGYEMSLFYPEAEKENRGKTESKEDRFTVKFLELIPDKKIVQAVNFSTDNSDFSGEMKMEISLVAKENGTEVTFLFKDIPKGIKPEENEEGTRSSLEKLARYVEK